MKKLRKLLKRSLLTALGNIVSRQKKVFFYPFQRDYTCNAKYIAEEMLKRKINCKLVWVIKDDSVKENFPSGIKLVRRRTLSYYWELLTSRIWVCNAHDIFSEELPKQKDQVLINTWHGSMGLKRIGIKEKMSARWLEQSKRCNLDTDFMVSNSTFESGVYKESYWPDVPILEYGHPRNDILLDGLNAEAIKARVCERLNIPVGKKLVLYAPTFRKSTNLDPYCLDFQALKKALHDRFGGDWLVLSRQHTKLINNKKAIDMRRQLGDLVVDATNYPDIQELLVAADVGITDYSSWICDYVLTGKPGFIFATDLESYGDERGFYYPLESTPFPVASSNEQMIKNVLGFDMDLYLKKQQEFLNARGCWENGDASAKCVDKIVQLLG